MTLTIAIAAAIFALSVFVEVLRANRRKPLFGPSPCERDAQDGRGEGGEGQGAFHSQPIKTILEQDHA